MPLKLKPENIEKGHVGTCHASIRPVQGVGPVQIQINRSPPRIVYS